jgi:3',5'-cyclic AMP phosphodiesterase CpdA
MIKKLYGFLAILLLLFTVSCSGGKQKAFSFIQLGDPQLGMGGYEHDVETLKQAVEQINKLDCDFVVICGDLVHHVSDSAYARFQSIIERLDVPCYLVAGNHDVGNVPDDSTLSYYRKTLGKDYYEFRNQGYAFIITNSQLWKTDIGEESRRHDSWLRETLERQSTEQVPVIVVGHHPMFIDQLDEAEQYSNLPVDKREELLNLFAGNNVKAYLSGHRHKTLVNRFQEIQLVTGETTSKNFDKRPMGFRQWEVSADTLMHHFVPLEPFGDIRLQELPEIKENL